MCASDLLRILSPFKSSPNLLFFFLCPLSECVRIFIACLRDDRFTVFVILTPTDGASAFGSSSLGYHIGPVF
jgi:hypothetical protein